MDLSCIILSGDLELYVLGLLPQDEADKVAQLALLFPEVREELDRISLSLEDVANKAEGGPSPAVKDRLMDKLRVLKAEEQQAIVKEGSVPDKKSSGLVVPMDAPRKNRAPLMAASVIALVVSIGAVIYLLQQNNSRTQQVTALQQQVNVLQQNSSEQQQQLQASTQALALWQNNAVRKLDLTSVPGKPAALAKVFWNQQTGDVYLSDISLPAAPAGKQYQLWAIVDGKPVDAGMLSSGKRAVQKMKTFETAQAFAITLEKEGGSPTPTMEEMYVMANAT